MSTVTTKGQAIVDPGEAFTRIMRPARWLSGELGFYFPGGSGGGPPLKRGPLAAN